MSNNNTLKEIYGLDELKDERYSLVAWYDELINKTMDEITYADAARMLRQGVFVEIAMDKAIKYLTSDPFIGDLYTGELIASLLEVEDTELEKRKPDIEKIIGEAKKNIDSFPWGYPEEREECMDLIEQLETKLYRKDRLLKMA